MLKRTQDTRRKPAKDERKLFENKLLDYVQLERKRREVQPWIKMAPDLPRIEKMIASGTQINVYKKTQAIPEWEMESLRSDVQKIKKSGLEYEQTVCTQKQLSDEITEMDRQFKFAYSAINSFTDDKNLKTKGALGILTSALMLVGLPTTALMAGGYRSYIYVKNKVSRLQKPYDKQAAAAYSYWKIASDLNFAKNMLMGSTWNAYKLGASEKPDSQIHEQFLDSTWAFLEESKTPSSAKKATAFISKSIGNVGTLAQIPIIMGTPFAHDAAVYISRSVGALELFIVGGLTLAVNAVNKYAKKHDGS